MKEFDIPLTQTASNPSIKLELGTPTLNLSEPKELEANFKLLHALGKLLDKIGKRQNNQGISIREILTTAREDRLLDENDVKPRGTLSTPSSGRSEMLFVHPEELAEIFPEVIAELKAKYGILNPESGELELPGEMMILIKGGGTGPKKQIRSSDFEQEGEVKGFTPVDDLDLRIPKLIDGQHIFKYKGQTIKHTYGSARVVLAVIPLKKVEFIQEDKEFDPTIRDEPLVLEIIWERGGHNFLDLKTRLSERGILDYFKKISKNDAFFSDRSRLSSETLILKTIEKYLYDSIIESRFYQEEGYNRSLQNMTFLGGKDLDDIDPKHSEDYDYKLALTIFFQKLKLLLHLIPLNLCKLVINNLKYIINEDDISEQIISEIFIRRPMHKLPTTGDVDSTALNEKVKLLIKYFFNILDTEILKNEERSQILIKLFEVIELDENNEVYFDRVLSEEFNLGNNTAEVLQVVRTSAIRGYKNYPDWLKVNKYLETAKEPTPEA